MKQVPMQFEAASRTRTLEVMVASSPLTRMRGLLARPALRGGEGMLIKPCNMIHTLGMRYPIDVVFMRRDGLVLKVSPAVAPRRMRGHFGAHCVLELAAGEAQRCDIVPGLTLPIGAM
jgi:uncharacterized protein